MRRGIRIVAAALTVAGTLWSISSQAQHIHCGETFELGDSLASNQDHRYTASNYIELKKGFVAEPDRHRSTLLQLDTEGLGIYPPEEGLTDSDGNVVGSLGGTVNVGAMGGLVYSIPIELPAGINGMQPNLSVTYNSQSGNGLLGWGWDLAGLSSITRAGQTLYHDGKMSAPIISWDDRFLLDGMRLITVAEFSDSIEYRMEQDAMARIMAYIHTENTGQDRSTERVLDSFKVWKADGLIMQYGSTADSWIEPKNGGSNALCWLLSKVSDRNGNSMTYHYFENQNNGEFHINTIEYTENEGQGVEAQFVVAFNYTDNRPDNEYYCMGGNSMLFQYKLTSITVKRKTDSKRLCNYCFQYELSLERHYQILKSMEMEAYDSNGNIEKTNATSINWNSTPTHHLDQFDISNPGIFTDFPFTGDFNGDGYTDVALVPYKDTTVYPGPVNITVYLNDRNGGFVHVPGMDILGVDASLDWVHVLDINGDGADDLVPYFYDTIPSDGEERTFVKIYLSNPVTQTVSIVGNLSVSAKADAIVGDFNGDGTCDIILLEKKFIDTVLDQNKGWHRTMPFIKNAHFMGFRHGQLFTYQLNSGSLENLGPVYNATTADFDGDGTSEVLLLSINVDTSPFRGSKIARFDFNDCNNCLKVIQDLTNPGNYPYYNIGSQGQVWCHVFPGDFNGDGLADILFYSLSSWKICFSNGKTLDMPLIITGASLPHLNAYINLYYPSLQSAIQTSSYQYITTVTVGDFDGDGCTDVGYTLGSTSEMFFAFRISTRYPGNRYFRKTFRADNGFRFHSQFIHTGNFLGRDNLSFLSSLPPENHERSGTVKIYSLKSIMQYNSVKSITDGMGNTTSFTYDWLSSKASNDRDSFYSFSFSVPDANGIMPFAPLAMALETVTVNGVNRSKSITKYSYRNAMFHKFGHGFMGFRTTVAETYHNSTDSTWTNRMVRWYEYSTMGQHAMMLPESDTLYIPDGNGVRMVENTSFTFENVRLANNHTHLVVCPAMTAKTERSYRMEGAAGILKTTHTEYRYDYNGNNTYNKSYGCTSTNQAFTGYENGNSHCELTTEKIMELETFESTWVLNRPCRETLMKTRNGQTLSTVTRYVYGSQGSYQPRSVTVVPSIGNSTGDPLTTETAYTYDAFGNIASVVLDAPYGAWGEEARVVSYEYGAATQHRLPTRETRGGLDNGYATDYEYDFHDRLRCATDCNGKRTRYETSTLGNDRTTLRIDGTGQRFLTLWADTSPYSPEGAAYYTWSKSSGRVTAMTFYHKSGAELRSVTFDFNGAPVLTDKKYNAKGLLEGESAPYRIGEPEEDIQWTLYRYDAHDRMVRMDYPDGSSTLVSYDGLATVTTTMPSSGDPVATPQSVSRKMNALGWLTESTEAVGTSHPTTVFYEYYADGNLKWTRIGDDETTKVSMEYDNAGNRTRLHDPDYCTAQDDLTSVYNAFGEEVSRRTPRGLSTAFCYDSFGRLTGLYEENGASQGPNSIAATLWTYGENAPLKGLLTSVTHPNQTVSYTYDTCQRLVGETVQLQGGGIYTTQYTYDSASRTASVTHPSGVVTNYTYNAVGYQRMQTDASGHVLYKTNRTNPLGQTERFTLGNGMVSSLEYDPETHLLAAIRTKKEGLDVQNLLLDYDGFCNLAARTDSTMNLEETFTYDQLNRLTEVRLGIAQTGAMAYDSYGRMTSKTADGSAVFSNAVYGLTSKPHAIDRADAASSPFPSASQSVAYTMFDKVRTVRQGNDSIRYTYGIDHRRLLMEERVGNTLRTKRYMGNCEYVTTATGNVTFGKWLTYLSGPTGVYAVVVTENGNDEIHYILKDNLGSWTVVTDDEGNVEQRLSYDAWGNLRNPGTWSGSFNGTPMFDRGFTGHEHLYAFGLINMNGRMYDPVMSSFLSVDRYIQSPGNAQDFNRYAYCLNNPLKYVDPSGWQPVGGYLYYTLKSHAQANDPYAYVERAYEPRDLGLRQLSTADPIITWMEENSLHRNGGGVKPAGDAEVEVIRNTLPKEARGFVQIDEKGLINKSLLNLCKAESLNLNNLKTLVNSEVIIEIVLDDGFYFMNENGIICHENMTYYPFDPLYPEDKDIFGDTPTGLSTGETGYLGQTLFPGLNSHYNSINDHVFVIIEKYLSPAGASEMYSHEANGHVLSYILNGKDSYKASHDFDGAVDRNTQLIKMIINSKKETIYNMQRR